MSVQGRSIGVSNEPSQTPSQLLHPHFAPPLQELFRPFGPISRVFLAVDRTTGENRGFAFVNYIYREDAERAIRNLNGGCLLPQPACVRLRWAVAVVPQRLAPTGLLSGARPSYTQVTATTTSFCAWSTRRPGPSADEAAAAEAAGRSRARAAVAAGARCGFLLAAGAA